MHLGTVSTWGVKQNGVGGQTIRHTRSNRPVGLPASTVRQPATTSTRHRGCTHDKTISTLDRYSREAGRPTPHLLAPRPRLHRLRRDLLEPERLIINEQQRTKRRNFHSQRDCYPLSGTVVAQDIKRMSATTSVCSVTCQTHRLARLPCLCEAGCNECAPFFLEHLVGRNKTVEDG